MPGESCVSTLHAGVRKVLCMGTAKWTHNLSDTLAAESLKSTYMAGGSLLSQMPVCLNGTQARTLHSLQET